MQCLLRSTARPSTSWASRRAPALAGKTPSSHACARLWRSPHSSAAKSDGRREQSGRRLVRSRHEEPSPRRCPDPHGRLSTRAPAAGSSRRADVRAPFCRLLVPGRPAAARQPPARYLQAAADALPAIDPDCVSAFRRTHLVRRSARRAPPGLRRRPDRGLRLHGIRPRRRRQPLAARGLREPGAADLLPGHIARSLSGDHAVFSSPVGMDKPGRHASRSGQLARPASARTQPNVDTPCTPSSNDCTRRRFATL